MSNGLSIGFNFRVLTPKDLEKIGELMLEIIDRRFAGGVTPDGTPFKAYSARYKAQLAKEGQSATPDMVHTGAFRRSWAVEITKNSAGSVLTLVPRGTPDQLKGWAIANRARPVAGLSADEIDEIMTLAISLLKERLKGRITRGR